MSGRNPFSQSKSGKQQGEAKDRFQNKVWSGCRLTEKKLIGRKNVWAAQDQAEDYEKQTDCGYEG